jgi:hypothetical protein
LIIVHFIAGNVNSHRCTISLASAYTLLYESLNTNHSDVFLGRKTQL